MGRSISIIARIAAALDIPTDALSTVPELSDERAAWLADAADLIEAFEQITDRQARRRCVSFVKTAADQSRRV